MRRLLLPLAFAIPALIGAGAQASEDLVWSYTPWETQDLLAQAEADEAGSEGEDQDNDWRLYLDLYGFLPIDASGSTTLDGNTNNINWDLGDVIDNVSSVLTLRAGVEFDRWGLQTGINHSSFDGSASASRWNTTERSRIRRLTGNEVIRSLTLKGDVDSDVHLDQTLIDIAVRYRAGDVQRPKMPQGSASFVGFAGARIVDGTISADIDVELSSSYEGPILQNQRSGKKHFSESWSHTWVQPLIGMHASYALSPEWQAFVYADAAGFGLAGHQDMSGTAQAGVAYAIGNSTQISLSYKYFGLAYAADSNDQGYETTAHGPNLGLRFVFN